MDLIIHIYDLCTLCLHTMCLHSGLYRPQLCCLEFLLRTLTDVRLSRSKEFYILPALCQVVIDIS
jgi:hypothetical protein